MRSLFANRVLLSRIAEKALCMHAVSSEMPSPLHPKSSVVMNGNEGVRRAGWVTETYGQRKNMKETSCLDILSDQICTLSDRCMPVVPKRKLGRSLSPEMTGPRFDV